jgi:3',5'-cyclic AMP phosphodiesterase CpdA
VSEKPAARLARAFGRRIRRSSGSTARFSGDVSLRRTGRFAVVGDLQRTSLAEIFRESNERERDRLVREIAARGPDFLVCAGDLVFAGSSRLDWEEFDALTRPLRDAGVPMLPILGNHDYWPRKSTALRNYFARFPHVSGRRWYSVAYGPLGLVFLDSNEKALGPALWSEEAAWFASEIARFDADRAVRGTVVFVHHPPFTNSTVTTDESHVQRAFVPPFLAAKKTLAMISGHVHSYEQFAKGGKTFLVTGGGGGPRVRLASGAARRHSEDAFVGPEVRHFHFLLCAPGADGLQIEVVGLEKGARAFATLTRFTLSWA